MGPLSNFYGWKPIRSLEITFVGLSSTITRICERLTCIASTFKFIAIDARKIRVRQVPCPISGILNQFENAKIVARFEQSVLMRVTTSFDRAVTLQRTVGRIQAMWDQ